jgi:hypothetical protein
VRPASRTSPFPIKVRDPAPAWLPDASPAIPFNLDPEMEICHPVAGVTVLIGQP